MREEALRDCELAGDPQIGSKPPAPQRKRPDLHRAQQCGQSECDVLVLALFLFDTQPACEL